MGKHGHSRVNMIFHADFTLFHAAQFSLNELLKTCNFKTMSIKVVRHGPKESTKRAFYLKLIIVRTGTCKTRW